MFFSIFLLLLFFLGISKSEMLKSYFVRSTFREDIENDVRQIFVTVSKFQKTQVVG